MNCVAYIKFFHEFWCNLWLSYVSMAPATEGQKSKRVFLNIFLLCNGYVLRKDKASHNSKDVEFECRRRPKKKMDALCEQW